MNNVHLDAEASELRQLGRHPVNKTVNIFNTFTGEPLGALVNVSSDGLMIVSQQPIDRNRIYQVTLDLPETIEGGPQVALVIDCLWSKQAGNQTSYWSGFYIIDADAYSMDALHALIDTETAA